jgi:death on curing protein
VTEFLDLKHILTANKAVTGDGGVRDIGSVESACFRPQASAFGEDAYPTIWEKAAALMQSLACNHGFVDGNKRTAWTATMAFLTLNGHPLDPAHDRDDAVALVLAVATGEARDVRVIANELVKFTIR